MRKRIIDEYPLANDACDVFCGPAEGDTIPVEDVRPAEPKDGQSVYETADDTSNGLRRRAPSTAGDESFSDAEKRHRRLKDLVLKPIVSVSLAVTTVAGALGIDFLGFDMINSESGDHILQEYLFGEGFHDSDRDHWDDWDDEEDEEDEWDMISFDQSQYPNAQEYDSSFPSLDNPDPDFDGNYAGGGMGTEEYIRLSFGDGEGWKYLVAGSYWVDYEDAVIIEPYGGSGGAKYDSETNTLTLANFTAEDLDVNLMGNGFKIELEGENHLRSVTVWGFHYGGSVTFTGEGTLYVNNPSGAALLLHAEGSASCVMFDTDVNLLLEGEAAIYVSDTTLEKSVYFLAATRVYGGRYYWSLSENSPDEPTDDDPALYNGYYVCPEELVQVTETVTAPQGMVFSEKVLVESRWRKMNKLTG